MGLQNLSLDCEGRQYLETERPQERLQSYLLEPFGRTQTDAVQEDVHADESGEVEIDALDMDLAEKLARRKM